VQTHNEWEQNIPSIATDVHITIHAGQYHCEGWVCGSLISGSGQRVSAIFVTLRRFQDELEESVNSLEMPCIVFGEPPTLVTTTKGALYHQQLDALVNKDKYADFNLI